MNIRAREEHMGRHQVINGIFVIHADIRSQRCQWLQFLDLIFKFCILFLKCSYSLFKRVPGEMLIIA